MFEIVIDLVAQSWTHAVCAGDADRLAIRRGKLEATQRAQVESAYAAIVVDPVSGGGHDGGTTSLTLAVGDGGVVRYVDRNWRDVSPPPPAFRDHQVFVKAVAGAIPAPP